MSRFDHLEENPLLTPSEIVRAYLEESGDQLDGLFYHGALPCFWSRADSNFYQGAIRDLAIDPDSFRLGLLVGLLLGERDAGEAMSKKRTRWDSKWRIARQIWLGMSEEKRESVLAKEVRGMICERFEKFGYSPKEAERKAGTLPSFQSQWAGQVAKWKKEIQQRKVALP